MDAPAPDPLRERTVLSPDEVLQRARDMLVPIADRPGAVLFSGRNTLVRGSLYVMGWNPGGRTEGPSAENGTIGGSLEHVPEDWSSYADEVYDRSGQPSELQGRIRTVFEALGADPRQTFATNALFERSPGEEELVQRNDGVWRLWWDHCWPVHQLFLHVVRPRVIVCLGCGPDPSTFELLRLTKDEPGRPLPWNWPSPREEPAELGKLRENVLFDLGDFDKHRCTVVGLPHPSPRVREGWPLTPEALMKIERARQRIVDWERADHAP